MSETVNLGARLNGENHRIDIISDTFIKEGGEIVGFGMLIGYDDDEEELVKTFAAYYEKDGSDIDLVKSSLKTGKRAVVGGVFGGTVDGTVRRGAAAMRKGMLRGGAIGVAVSVAWELGKYYYENMSTGEEIAGYVSEDGDIIDKVWE